MSLFGRIVSNVVGNKVQTVIGNKVGDAISDQIDKVFPGASSEPGTPSVVGYDIDGKPIFGPPTVQTGDYSEQGRGASGQSYDNTSGADEPTKDRAWFANVLATSFVGHTVRENVSPIEFGGPADARKYDFVVYSGATPKAAIVLPTNNRSEAYKAARASAEGAGIAFLPFWLTMWNKHDYVVNRIGAAL
jgi:hypothetical protein